MKVAFNSRDALMLTINLLTLRMFTRLPMDTIRSASSAAPIVTLVSGALSVFVIFVIALWLSRYTRGNLTEGAQRIFGVWGKAAVAAIAALCLFVSQIFVLSDLSRFVALVAFPTSPMWFVAGFLTLGGILGAMTDIRGNARLHGVFVPVILIILLLLIGSCLIPNKNTQPMPLLPRQGVPLFKDIAVFAAQLGDALPLFLLAPTEESRQSTAKTIAYGAAAALALNTLFVLAFVLNIPSAIVQNGQFPVYLLMKEVYFGRFFQRLDAFVLLASALSAMLYLSLNLCLTRRVLHQGFGIPDKPLVSAILGAAAFAAVLNQWIFPSGVLKGLVYTFGCGGLGLAAIVAIFVKVRGMLDEKI